MAYAKRDASRGVRRVTRRVSCILLRIAGGVCGEGKGGGEERVITHDSNGKLP